MSIAEAPTEASQSPSHSRSSEPPRVDVLGIGLSAVDMSMAVDRIATWIETREPNFVTVSGVHGVMESVRDESLRRIHNQAGMVTPDGMPMVWLAKRAGQRHVTRVYGPDLMLETLQAGLSRQWKHYFYGGKEGIADELRDRLRERFPGLIVVGTECPPFRALTEEEDQAVCDRIAASGADIVWVGLSTPKQERWMAAHVGRIGAPVAIGVGAAFDFHTGKVKQAPRWMQANGLEWLFRLYQEPKRLWRRYLRNNPAFVTALLMKRLRLRRFGSIDDR